MKTYASLKNLVVNQLSKTLLCVCISTHIKILKCSKMHKSMYNKAICKIINLLDYPKKVQHMLDSYISNATSRGQKPVMCIV